MEIRDGKPQLRAEIQSQVSSSEAKGEGLFIALFIQSVFTEHLLCAGHCSRLWDTAVNKTKSLPSQGSHSCGGAGEGACC